MVNHGHQHPRYQQKRYSKALGSQMKVKLLTGPRRLGYLLRDFRAKISWEIKTAIWKGEKTKTKNKPKPPIGWSVMRVNICHLENPTHFWLDFCDIVGELHQFMVSKCASFPILVNPFLCGGWKWFKFSGLAMGCTEWFGEPASYFTNLEKTRRFP